MVEAQGLPVAHVELGEVELLREPNADECAALRDALQVVGFDLVDDRDATTIERIKAAIVQLVHHDGVGVQTSAWSPLEETTEVNGP